MSKLFLPQAQMEEWALGEKADVQGEALAFQGDNARYPVVEAVHFVKVESGPDAHKLVGKVKSQAQLAQLGAEVLSNSAIVGESAYEVVPGYLVEVKAAPAPAAERPRSAPQPQDQDLLAKFLLNKL